MSEFYDENMLTRLTRFQTRGSFMRNVVHKCEFVDHNNLNSLMGHIKHVFESVASQRKIIKEDGDEVNPFDKISTPSPSLRSMSSMIML